MKNRKTIAPRNPYVAAAKFRKAGLHEKSAKAVRHGDKITLRRVAHLAEHLAFNQGVESSTLSTPTSNLNKQADCIQSASLLAWLLSPGGFTSPPVRRRYPAPAALIIPR